MEYACVKQRQRERRSLKGAAWNGQQGRGNVEDTWKGPLGRGSVKEEVSEKLRGRGSVKEEVSKEQRGRGSVEGAAWKNKRRSSTPSSRMNSPVLISRFSGESFSEGFSGSK